MSRAFLSMQVKGVVVVEDVPSGPDLPVPQSPDATEMVANRPIADHVIDALESAGVNEIVIACSTLSSRTVRRCLAASHAARNADLGFVEHEPGLELAGVLGSVAPAVGSAPCIVHVADGLLGEPLKPLLGRLRVGSPDLVVTVHSGTGAIRRLSAPTRQMLRLAELYPDRAALGLAGVLLFGPGALRSASCVRWDVDGETDLTQAACGVAAAGGTLRVVPVAAWCRYVGDPLDLLELNRIALDRLEFNPHPPTNQGNRIEGRVFIHEQARVRGTVLVGPVVIGPRARISDAYIGPYTSIGAEVRIEGAEIERSIIGSGASIMHVGGRLVASVVGRDARVFRDFSLPRALRLRVGDGTEVALC